MNPEHLIRAYYTAFNAGDFAGMLALLHPEIEHDINQAGRETGLAAFEIFLQRMHASYRENIADLVVLTEPGGQRAAAEFIVHGEYLQADHGLPPACGQTYVLPCGAFFAFREGKIARVTNYYNLADWLAQVAG